MIKKTFFFLFILHFHTHHIGWWYIFRKILVNNENNYLKILVIANVFFLQSKRTRKIVILFTRIDVNKFTVKKTLYTQFFCLCSSLYQQQNMVWKKKMKIAIILIMMIMLNRSIWKGNIWFSSPPKKIAQSYLLMKKNWNKSILSK